LLGLLGDIRNNGQIFDACHITATRISAPKSLKVAVNTNIQLSMKLSRCDISSKNRVKQTSEQNSDPPFKKQHATLAPKLFEPILLWKWLHPFISQCGFSIWIRPYSVLFKDVF
jgi:hypothetical protein